MWDEADVLDLNWGPETDEDQEAPSCPVDQGPLDGESGALKKQRQHAQLSLVHYEVLRLVAEKLSALTTLRASATCVAAGEARLALDLTDEGLSEISLQQLLRLGGNGGRFHVCGARVSGTRVTGARFVVERCGVQVARFAKAALPHTTHGAGS